MNTHVHQRIAIFRLFARNNLKFAAIYSDVNKAISVKAKARQYKAKARGLQGQGQPIQGQGQRSSRPRPHTSKDKIKVVNLQTTA